MDIFRLDMDKYEKETERIRKLLSDCDGASDPEDDSEGESDGVMEDGHVPDSDCYESEVEDSLQEAQCGRSRQDGWLGKDQKTWWGRQVPNAAVRTQSHNVVRERGGPRGQALTAKSPSDFWGLFITPKMVDLLVEKTNLFISEIRSNYSEELRARETDCIEIKAFIGLILLAGIYRSNRMNLSDLWASDGTGVEVFRLTMSLHRFRFLLRCLRFDDKETRSARRRVDKLAPIRELFEMFVDNCQRNYSPSEYMTIDEMLVSFRGKCPFRVYIPSKPAKYGIKIQAMADAKTFYVCKMEIYTGRQPDGPFNVDNSAISVVTRLTSEIKGSGRNVTFDNWYTSYPLILKLLDDSNLTAVGTLRKNKREIPAEFLVIKDRNRCDSVFGFTSKMTLTSYTSYGKKKKNVVLLSSMHHDNGIDPDSGDKKKPYIITFYNATKGGIDIVDKMSGEYNTTRNSRRWPMVVFYSLLNISTINSYILFCHNPQNKLQRRLFIKNVSMQLIQDTLRRRVQNMHIKKDLREEIRRLLHGPRQLSVDLKTQIPKVAKRCSFCSRSRDRKVKSICESCGRHVCSEHSKMYVSCIDCQDTVSNGDSE